MKKVIIAVFFLSLALSGYAVYAQETMNVPAKQGEMNMTGSAKHAKKHKMHKMSQKVMKEEKTKTGTTEMPSVK
jgi:hypothetical protein